MDQTTKDKLATNVSNSWKMASVQATAVLSIFWGAYAAMPPEMQQTLLTHLPVPPWALGIISWAITYVARVWPQKSITPDVAAAKSTDAVDPDHPDMNISLVSKPMPLGSANPPTDPPKV